jgi:hypothetical protein
MADLIGARSIAPQDSLSKFQISNFQSWFLRLKSENLKLCSGPWTWDSEFHTPHPAYGAMGLWGARPSPVAVFGVPAEYIFPSRDKAVFELFIRDNWCNSYPVPFLFASKRSEDGSCLVEAKQRRIPL